MFLDNDKTGENCKKSILKSFPEAKNHSEIYALHKDLNDYFFKTTQKIEKQQGRTFKPKTRTGGKENQSNKLQKKTLIMRAYFYQLYAKVRSSFATLKVDALPTKFLLRSARL